MNWLIPHLRDCIFVIITFSLGGIITLGQITLNQNRIVIISGMWIDL